MAGVSPDSPHILRFVWKQNIYYLKGNTIELQMFAVVYQWFSFNLNFIIDNEAFYYLIVFD